MSTPASTAIELASFESLPAQARVGPPVVRRLYGGISPATLWRHVKAGLIAPPIKHGKRNYWNVGELRDALAKR